MRHKISATIAALSTVAALAASGTIYPATLVITKIEDGTKYMERATGYEYQFDAAEDDMEGDLVSCIMYNNGTPETIEDDIVITARYSGWYIY